MPLEKTALEDTIAALNRERRADHAIRIERYEPPGKFTLSFPDRPMSEGQCIDQDFTAIQFALLETRNVSTDLVSGREADGRYLIDYQVVEWD